MTSPPGHATIEAREAASPTAVIADKRKASHERRVLWTALAGGLPAVAVSLGILWTGDYSPKVQWTLSLLILGSWLGFAFDLRERVVFPLRTLSNLLAALREGDYSLRARVGRQDALGEVMSEVNIMGRMLREQRLGAIEATTLLRKVMSEIDVAVFAFDGDDRLRLVNRMGAQLLGRPEQQLLGVGADELGLSDCLDGDPGRTLEKRFPGGSGRWGLRRTRFREHGMPHRLLVLSDLTSELRQEELKAWQRLVRVLGHELNNSLAPIKSIAASLKGLLGGPALPRSSEPPSSEARSSEALSSEALEDMRQGLDVIGSRADALSRFMGAYARLAKLPEPAREPVSVSEWVLRVVGLETRMRVQVDPGPSLSVQGDNDQLDQLLINLVRNAVDAASETGGDVRVSWKITETRLEVRVRDEGPGLSSEANLFVPFFTTKPGGSGIGLVLCRKIAENHRGVLTLENRADRTGCEACLSLPLSAARKLTPGAGSS